MSTSSEYLYRIVSYSRALDLFETRQLHFAPPAKWADPFETMLCHPRSHALFAQCWCKKSVSDAMWRIYSPNQQSVRLRTTLTKLKACTQARCAGGELSSWVREVDYRTPSKVRTALLRLSQQLGDHYSVNQAVEALFYKRDAFDYENEVRVVVHDERALEQAQSLRLEVDPHELVESIMFDPRVEPAFYNASKRHLEKTVGFKGSIGRSALYRLQRQLIVA